MNIRCAFGWHRWKELWRFGSYSPWSIFRLDASFHIGRICADCRKRDINR